MGANTSKQRYDQPNHYYDGYFKRKGIPKPRTMPQMSTPYPQQMMPMPNQMYPFQMQYPHPQMVPNVPQQIIFPLLMHPMHQISGPPVGQHQTQQIPQPVIPQNATNFIPQPAPILPMPQPQIPLSQTSGQPISQPQPQPQSQPPPQPQLPLNSGLNGAMNVPRSMHRNHVESASGSDSDTSIERDPLASNPLPRPPREIEVPPHLIAGSAVTYTASIPPGPIDSEPLRNPLPPPPKDVYTSRKYRELIIGSAYEDRKDEVYPEGWFDERGHRKEGSRSGFLSRLNPFREHSSSPSPAPMSTPLSRSGHRRVATAPELPVLPEILRESSGSGSSDSFKRSRLFGLGRFGRKREKGGGIGMARGTPFPRNVPSLVADTVEIIRSPAAMPSATTSDSDLPIGFMPFPDPIPTPQVPPAGFVPSANSNAGHTMITPQMPQPQPALTPSPNVPPLVHSQGDFTPQPEPAHPLSPDIPNVPVIPPLHAAQGPSSPSQPSYSRTPSERTVVKFNASSPIYSGFCHYSPHRVLYNKKLYPSAAHLLLAHQFLENSDRQDLAECIRRTENFNELQILMDSWRAFVRQDWGAIVLHKIEEVLYHKFVQHPELRELLLGTGLAHIIFSDPFDTFLGEGPQGGGNELGKALVRIRERLRQEAGDY